jgi:hypothetical protein
VVEFQQILTFQWDIGWRGLQQLVYLAEDVRAQAQTQISLLLVVKSVVAKIHRE